MVLKCCSFLFIIVHAQIESFANKFYKRVQQSNLPAGNVRLLAVTEKQFSEMTLIVGGKTKQEEVVSDNKLVVI